MSNDGTGNAYLDAIDAVIDEWEARCSTEYERQLVAFIRDREQERRRSRPDELFWSCLFWLYAAGGLLYAAAGLWSFVREVLR